MPQAPSNSLAVAAFAGYITAHAGPRYAAAYAATHSDDVVFWFPAAAPPIEAAVIGALAPNRLPGAATMASGTHGAMQPNAQLR